MREDVYADDEDYTLKFFDDYVCKPMSSGFEDEIQCQSNFQEMHFQSQKQLEDFKLKLDNKNHHHQVQIEGLKAKMQELILQEQELKVQNQVIMEMVKQTTRWNDVQFTSALRYLYSSMCSIIPVFEVSMEISRPLTHYDHELRGTQEPSQQGDMKNIVDPRQFLEQFHLIRQTNHTCYLIGSYIPCA